HTRLNLYSAHPFPHRQDRVMDDFGKAAVAYLTRHPDEEFIRVENDKEGEIVRVAVADRMTEASCVNCHNSLANSPKKDWKLGDTRGVLEVAVPAGAALKAGSAVAWKSALLVAFSAVLVFGGIGFIMKAANRRLEQAVKAIE